MKKSIQYLFSTIFCWLLVQAYPVATEEEVICPDSNPLNCYPKLFVPTKEWQTVKQGQIIPVGLDIRLDLESLSREAKLMDNSDSGSDSNSNTQNKMKNHELVVSNSDVGFHSSLEIVKKFANMKNPKIEFSDLIYNLDILNEWSSDRESGVMIAQNIQPLLKLSGLYAENNFNLNSGQYLQVQDMVYRILSSSFRNNIDAQTVLINYLNEPNIFLQKLAKNNYANESTLIIKRKLGLLGSLLNNGNFEKEFKKGGVETELITLYSNVTDLSIRERIMNILEDIKLNKRDDEGLESYADQNLDKRFASIVQENLIKSTLEDNSESKQVLESLSKLKEAEKSRFKVSNKFLDWMDKQINIERNNVKINKRNDDKYLNKLIEMRHEIFGNRLGSRKEYIDEL